MVDFSRDDITKPLVTADEKFGVFEPDPNDPFIQRYIPSDRELERLNSWLKEEIETAWNDDQPLRSRKLRLLDAYRCTPDGKDQSLVLPLVKRAVRRNVAYAKGKILGETPILSVKPTSNKSIQVLVEDPQMGTVPLDKSSEDVAQATEWWLDYKLRNCINFAEIVDVAVTEAKRGQTPTWIKVVHHEAKRIIKAPRYQKQGPISVTFNSKDDLEVNAGDATSMENVSTYSMLMPADEQDPQTSPWLAEFIPCGSEELRASLYNGNYFLIDKKEWETFIEQGIEMEMSPADQKRASQERRVPSVPRGKHDRVEVWFTWTVPMKQSHTSVDDEGEPQQKNIKVNQEYEMVGHFHRKHGRLMSMMRVPFDHGQRPYIPVFDRKEPFRHSGESIAEDVINYQNVISRLVALEIKGAVVATTPIFFAEPGSIAGDYVTEHEVEPGNVIPRLRPDEIEATTLGNRSVSLLGLTQFVNGEFDRATSIGNLQLGIDVPSRTPSSSIQQILNQGQTDANDFLERFCQSLTDAVVMYVKTVQQYMRTGEVIPFDNETKALVLNALQGDESQMGEGVPMRFPMAPITDQFMFSMTAMNNDSQQADFEKYVSFKQIVDEDGKNLANIIGPLASGNLPPTVEEALVQQVIRSQKLMERIGKDVAKDGESYSISPNLIRAIIAEQQQLKEQAANAPPPPPPPPQIKINLTGQLNPMEVDAAAQQALGNGAMNAQGTGPGGQPAGPQAGGPPMGGAVPQPGVPPVPHGNQGNAGGPPSGPPQ